MTDGWQTLWGEATEVSPVWSGKTKAWKTSYIFVNILDGAATEYEKSHWTWRAKLLQKQEGYNKVLKSRNEEEVPAISVASFKDGHLVQVLGAKKQRSSSLKHFRLLREIL